MPSIFGGPSPQFGSILSPRVGPGSGYSPSVGVPQLSEEARADLTEDIFDHRPRQNQQMPWYVGLANTVAGTGIDLVDTVASSANAISPIGLANQFTGGQVGPQRGDVWDLVGTFGEYGKAMQDYHSQNQAKIELLSGITGAVATGYVAGTMVLPKLTQTLAANTMISGSRIWQAGAAANASIRANVVRSNLEAAANGVAFEMRAPTAAAFIRSKVAKGVGVAAFEEAAIVGTMNQNDFIWSDDWSNNLVSLGFGMGVGGLLGRYSARHELRLMMNDATHIANRANYIDPQGFMAMAEVQPVKATAAQVKNMNNKESAMFTDMMIISRQQTPDSATPKLAAHFAEFNRTFEHQAVVSLQKMSVKGITGAPNTQFRVDTKVSGSAGKHFMQAAHDDPWIAFGVDSIGELKPAKYGQQESPMQVMLKARETHTENLRNTKKAGNIRDARRLEAQTPMVMYGKRFYPANTSEAKSLAKYIPNTLNLKQTTKAFTDFQFDTDSGKKMVLGTEFRPTVHSRNAPVETMAIVDRHQVLEATERVMRSMLSRGEFHGVPNDPTWFQLDAAIEFEKRGGQVQWSKTIKNADEARIESLKKKARAIRRMPNQKLGSHWDRLALNLPAPTAQERIYDPTGDGIKVLIEAAEQGSDLAQIKGLREILMDSGVNVKGDAKPDLDGDIFNWNRDEQGNWQAPVVAFFDNARLNKPLAAPEVAQMLAEQKIERVLHLMSMPSNPGIVPMMTQMIRSMPEFQTSSRIAGASDDQISGVGGWWRQAGGEILTREMRIRDSEMMQAAYKVSEAARRMTDAYLAELTKPLAEVQTRLTSAVGAPSRALVNQFYSLATGWDIKTLVPNGKFFDVVLAESNHNSARLGRAVEKNEVLKNPLTGQNVVLDDLANEFVERFTAISDQILFDKNRYRVALGLAPIPRKNFYAPPPDLRGKLVGFTLDQDGRAVPGGAIISSNEEEFRRLVEAKEKTLKPGWVVRRKSALDRTEDWFDQAAMDWINPGSGFAPVKTQTGSLSPDTINSNAIGDSLNWVKDQVEQIGTNTMRTLYDSQLRFARARGTTEAYLNNIPDDSAVRTIWDEYESIILGKTLSATDKSITGTMMKKVEKTINYALAESWPALRWMSPVQMSRWVADLADRTGYRTPKAVTTFSQLSKELGPYTPYKTAVDYAEQTLKVSRPPEIRGISEGLNRMSAALMLRYFELPMAAMNILGLITTMPSILRSGRAPLMSSYQHKGKRVGVVDSMQILMGATKDLTRMSKHADWDMMVKNGDTTQQVADFNRQMSLITDQSSFRRIMLGDKTIEMKNVKDVRSLKDVQDIAKNKGVDGLISVLTDTTENWSRTWSHFVGLRLADLQGITGAEARHSFARDISNAAIANYNPLNRPELFQSAVGSMFGLFASYMQSYNQRLFRWMEKGEYASIGRQLAMQSTLFGVASLPGFNAIQAGLLKAGYTETADGDEPTIVDHIYAKFGPELGTAIAHGGLSQTGIALYTRGDMNYRDLTLDPRQLMAGVGLLTQTATAVKEAGQHLFDANTLDDNGRIMEVIARNMPNRVMKGLIGQVVNSGRDTDANGQLVTETRSFYEAALRSMGVRSTFQQGRIEAFYANKAAEQREAGRMETLRLETRSLVRNDPNWQTKIPELFESYLGNGGRPEHFRQWIKDQLRSATSTRDVNDLMKALRSPTGQMAVWRYNSYSPE